MKRFMCFLTAISILCAFAICSFADDSELQKATISDILTSEDNEDALYITVSGKADTRLTAYIWADATSPDKFSSENIPLAFEQFDLAYGVSEFKKDIFFSKNIPTGKYYLKISDRTSNKTFEFRYYNEEELDKAKTALNNAITVGESEIKTVLENNKDNFLIDEAQITKYGNFIANVFFNRTDGSGNHIYFNKISDFQSLYDICIAMYDYYYRETGTDGIAYIKENADKLGADFDKYVAILSKDVQSEFVTLLDNNEGYKTKDFGKVVEEMSILAAVRKAQKWQDIKNIMTKTHFDTVKSYITSKDDKVFNRMMNYTYNSFADIETNYKLALKEPKNPGGNSPSGGKTAGAKSGTVMSGTPAVNKSPEVGFKDIDKAHWAINEISTLVQRKVLSGYEDGKFYPNKPITRAEFAKIAVCAFNVAKTGSASFGDVERGAWYSEYIAAAYTNGIINGTSESTFSPDALITRQDAAVIIYRILSKKGELKAGNKKFSDSDAIASYAADCVSALSNTGIITGNEYGAFEPAKPITRDAAAALIYRALNY